MKKILLSLCVMSIAFVGCKDDNDDVTCALNTAGVAAAYKITALTYKADAATPAVDMFALMDPCEKDDVITLNANNTVTYTDAGTQCVPPGNDTGTWMLSGSTITLDGEVGTISNYSCAGMTVTINGTTAGEVTTVTLARQ